MGLLFFFCIIISDPRIVGILVGNKCDLEDQRVINFINSFYHRKFLKNKEKKWQENMRI